MAESDYSRNARGSQYDFDKYINSQMHQEGLQQAIGLLQIDKNDVCLEVGCGPGFLAAAMAEHCWISVGIDSRKKFIEIARKVRDAKLTANLILAEAEPDEIPYPPEHFTKIATRMSMHHWRNPERVLRELRRVVARHGKLLIIDHIAPANYEYAALMDLIESMRDENHKRLIAEPDLKDLLDRTRWDIVVLEYKREREDLDVWLSRTHKEGIKEEIIKLLQNIPDDLREYIDLEQQGEKYYITFKTTLALCEPI